jgi:YgiT-type zinc finger domain-containing protein
MDSTQCEYCNGQIVPETVTVEYHYKSDWLLIEGVPARVCQRCGERYYDAAVVKDMERIAEGGSVVRTVTVPVKMFASLAAAA